MRIINMAFEFDFSDDSNDETEKPSKKLKIEEKRPPCQDVLPFLEVIPQFKLDETQKFVNYHFKKDIVLKCVQTTVDISTDSCNRDQQTLNPDKENSDLIPRIYEGGFKVWECSLDMIEYFIEQNIDFNSKKVLELGCGCGLPGLFALMHSAEFVHFQDYNVEVLKHVVVPNVALNVSKKHISSKDVSKCAYNAKFFAGDWSHFQEQDLVKYDLILSSETIYCPENYEKLHKIFENFLNPCGTCLIAAKTFYFGVGGGTRDFEDFVKKRDLFDIASVNTFTEGVQREILSLKFKGKGSSEIFK